MLVAIGLLHKGSADQIFINHRGVQVIYTLRSKLCNDEKIQMPNGVLDGYREI